MRLGVYTDYHYWREGDSYYAERAFFTFITSLEEFSLTYVIGTPDFQTIPTVLFSFLGDEFVRTHAAVVSLVLMVPNVVLLFVADRMLKTDYLSSGYGKL